jgi:hypothetical protein
LASSHLQPGLTHQHIALQHGPQLNRLDPRFRKALGRAGLRLLQPLIKILPRQRNEFFLLARQQCLGQILSAKEQRRLGLRPGLVNQGDQQQQRQPAATSGAHDRASSVAV